MLCSALCCVFALIIGGASSHSVQEQTAGAHYHDQSLLEILVQLLTKIFSYEQQTDKLTDDLRKVEAEQNKTQADMASLRASLHEQAAFSATFDHITQGKLNMGVHGILRFNKVVTNIGGGYDSQTGRFTAPYAGVYAFFCSIRSINDRDWVSVGIFKGDTRLAIATADGKIDPWDKGSALATTHLNRGDQVYIRHSEGDTYVEQGSITTFSGLLVTPD